jgi:hypothetical protein
MQKTPLLSGIIVLFTLIGCIATVAPQAQDNVNNPSTEATPEAPATPYLVAEGAIGPYTYNENINPLTGLAVADPAQLNRRPFVVKISNSPALVRPQ